MKAVMIQKSRRMRTLSSRHPQGSAALITTVAISAVLIVLFVGITTIATREISKSINADQANRALYAAEAGVEDAIRRLSTAPSLTEPTCNELTGNNGQEVPVISATGDPTGTAAWTCRTITQQSRDITGHLNKDETLQLNVSRARVLADTSSNLSPARYMTIEWNDPKVDAAVPEISPTKPASYLPGFSATPPSPWAGRAAALELTSVWLPSTVSQASLTGTGGVLPSRTVVASPVTSLAAGKYIDFSPWNGGATTPGCSTGNTNTQVCFPGTDYANPAGVGGTGAGDVRSNISAQCSVNASASYNCKLPANYTPPTPVTTTGKYDLQQLMTTEYDTGAGVIKPRGTVGTDPLFLRVKARYAGASYRIRFYDATGTQVYMPDGYATIDVTARSGDYFRRVVAKKLLQPTVYDGVFDNAVFSGGAICKTMTIYKDFRGAPDYSQTPDGSGGYTRTANPDAGRNQGCSDPNT